MTDKELKKLNRAELLEIMVAQSREIEELKSALEMREKELASRKIAIGQAGSIAEAALQLNGIFEAAQAAADQYLDNTKELTERQNSICAEREAESRAEADRMVAEATRRCQELEQDTKARCDAMKAGAKADAEEYWQEVSAKLEQYYNAHRGLRELLSIRTRTVAELQAGE